MGRCVLVTGGAGFIGSHTILELLTAGYNVVVIDNLDNSSVESLNRVADITGREPVLYEIDLCVKEKVEAVFAKHDIYAVIHFAGLKAVGESVAKPLLYYRNNLTSTMTLVEVMEAHNVQNLIFSSSATVYGIDTPGKQTEQTPVGSVSNPYGETKYWIEEMMAAIYKSQPERWNMIRLRYFNPIGAHPSGRIGEDPKGIPNNLVPYVSQVAIGRRAELSIFGSDYDTPDGTGVRDYVHVVDLALGHVAALRKIENTPDLGLATYNLGTGTGYSVLEVVAAMERASGKSIKYKFVARRPGDASMLYADTQLAEKELDWKAERGLAQMCADGWKWQSNNPNGYTV